MIDAGVMVPYIGFTEKEVCNLCSKYNCSYEAIVPPYKYGF